jgi:hypothetical protein
MCTDLSIDKKFDEIELVLPSLCLHLRERVYLPKMMKVEDVIGMREKELLKR